MSPLVIAVIAGVVTLFVMFKLLKLAIKVAFIGAVIAAVVVGYMSYAAT